MTNTIAHVEVTRLPELTPNLKILQLSIEHWEKMHAEAGLQKSEAWCMYAEAIENGESQKTIKKLFDTAQMLEIVCAHAWHEHEQAKANLLALWN